MQTAHPTSTPLGTVELTARAAVLVASAIGAALADTAPTGHDGADLLWRVGLAILVTAAGFTCAPTAQFVPALMAAAVAIALEAWGVAAAATLVLLASVVVPNRGRWAAPCGGAVVGASVALLFRLPDFPQARATTMLAVASCVPVVISGWRGAAPKARRTLGWTAGAAGVGLAAVLLPFLVQGVQARSDVARGTREVRAWRTATAEGDDEAASEHLDTAEAAFKDAGQRLDAWWVRPARLLPVVAQHRVAADTGATAGRRLVRSAKDIVASADPKDLHLTEGRFDLDLIADVQVAVTDGMGSLTAVDEALAEVEQDWLLPFIQSDVRRVADQVRHASEEAELADRVLEVAPGLLGADGTHRYFVVFSSPAETRELGGFLGNWGILTASDGQIELEQVGRARDLNDLNAANGVQLQDPESYPHRYVQAKVDEFWQNVTSTPDLPTASRAIADLYAQASGDAIDGVIVVDPVGLSALLEITGRVRVKGLGGPLTSDNAVDLLLRDQYVEFAERAERVDFLEDAAEATFDKLTTETLPGPARIARVLSPAVRGRHLLFWSLDPDTHDVLREMGLSGELPSADDQDVLAVARANQGRNKLDAYLREDLQYDVDIDEDGRVHAVLTATYTNEAPPGLTDYVAGNPDGLPVGTNRFLLSVWTPYRTAGATIDGEAVPLERQIELGLNRYLRSIDVPPGGSVTFTLELEGVIPPDGYRLTVLRQALGDPSPLDVDVHDDSDQGAGEGPKVTVIGG